MSLNQKSSKLFTTIIVLLAILLPVRAFSENITLLKQFMTLDGTIYFLPDAWISVWENGKSAYYKFHGDQFIKTDGLPGMLYDWEAYSGDADYLDQIARADYDPVINRFLPKQNKVKKVIETPIKSTKNAYLVLVCYTLKAADPDATPSSNDIYATALVSTQNGSLPTYKMLWTKELQADASYGEMTIQKIATSGQFLILYWGQVAGSGEVEGLNIYRLNVN